MILDLSQKQSDAWHHLEDNYTTELIYGGAAGGGKSYLGCIWHVYRRIRYPETRGLIGRSKLSNLKESTLVTLFKVASQMGYKSGRDYKYNGQDHTISWSNGSKTILKDLFLYPSDPDFTSLGSTEYTDAFIDEGTEITEKAFDIVNSRIRWKLSDYNLIPKILVTCNPSPGWVKNKYITNDTGKPIFLQNYQKVITALVTDNPDKEFQDIYINQLKKLSSNYDRERLLYGNWDAHPEVKNPFVVSFTDDNIADVKHDERKQLIISIDFNLDPFCVTFMHYWEDSIPHLHVFDEKEIHNGSIPAMADYIKGEYFQFLPYAKMTGDAMGNNRDITQRDNASLYKQLLSRLNMRPQQLQVKSNPTHKNSRADCNFFISNFDFKVNPKCKGLLNDIRSVEVDAFGQILKRDRNDPNQRADFLDAGLRYPVHNFAQKAIQRATKGAGKEYPKEIKLDMYRIAKM